jgi:hypothetical protein
MKPFGGASILLIVLAALFLLAKASGYGQTTDPLQMEASEIPDLWNSRLLVSLAIRQFLWTWEPASQTVRSKIRCTKV